MMIRFVLLTIVLISLLPSCRTTRKIQTAIARKDSVAAPVAIINSVNPHLDSIRFMRENYQRIMSNRIPLTTFSAKIEVDYTDAEGKKYNVNAHIRMYKDSIIWVSITAIFGIEGLRAYITKDSVKLLNRQDKVYTARSVSYLQEVTALPLDLSSLQDLLLGNPVFLDSNIVSYSADINTISLQSNGPFFKNLITIDRNNAELLSSKLDDIDELRSRTCYLTYDNKNGVNFSDKRGITVSEKKKLDIKLDFRQYEFNETLSFPFNVPKNYKRE
jgi:hypothetical protein